MKVKKINEESRDRPRRRRELSGEAKRNQILVANKSGLSSHFRYFFGPSVVPSMIFTFLPPWQTKSCTNDAYTKFYAVVADAECKRDRTERLQADGAVEGFRFVGIVFGTW